VKYNIVILGLGKSGWAVMRLLKSQKYSVLGVDKEVVIERYSRDYPEMDFIPEDNFTFHEGCRVLVKSPGIALSHAIVVEAYLRGIEVVSEAEIALRLVKAPVLAITGTNGKTTTTALVTHVLNYNGIEAHALGNIGEPLSEYIIKESTGVVVAELSSYQIETMSHRTIDCAVVLNIDEDHLDRYDNYLEHYAMAKFNISNNIKEGGKFYLNRNIAEKFFGIIPRSAEFFDCRKFSFKGSGVTFHENLVAAYLLCKYLGVDQSQFEEALKSFCGPPHRIEFVGEFGGVSFYNDSKGTNPSSVVCAVERLEKDIILLAGGVDKGASFEGWPPAFLGKVKNVILFGRDAVKINSALKGYFDVIMVEDLESATDKAFELAADGDKVLFSPGCASFDMFRDYIHRGNVFKSYIKSRLL